MGTASGTAPTSFIILGEAPGRLEDRRGEPFTGPAGSFLRRKLRHLGILPRAVFMNTVCCYPQYEENAKPQPDQLRACRPHLKAQMELVDGPWVLAVGTYASKALIRHLKGVTPAQGMVIPIHERLVFPVFHPSYILRQDDPDLEEQWVRQLERFARYLDMTREDVLLATEFTQSTCFYCGDVNMPGQPVCFNHKNDWRLDQAWTPARQKKLKRIPGQENLFG